MQTIGSPSMADPNGAKDDDGWLCEGREIERLSSREQEGEL